MNINYRTVYGSAKNTDIDNSPITLADYIVGLRSNGDGTHDEVAFPLASISGNGTISTTFSNFTTLLNSGSLHPEGIYYVTDLPNTDIGGILKANALGNGIEIYGSGYWYVADYQGIGNYSDVQTLTGIASGTLRGFWTAGNESAYNNGDIVIYTPSNDQHYQLTNKSQINGSSPQSNTSAYTLLPSSSTISSGKKYGYILDSDIIEYSIADQAPLWRIDKRGNIVNNESLPYFQFGNDNVHDVKILSQNNYCNIQLNSGEITGTMQGDNCFVYLDYNSNYIYFDINGTDQYLYAPSNTGNIEAHLTGFSSGLQAYNNSGDIRVYIYDASYASTAYNSGGIYARYYDQSFVIHDNNAGSIQLCEFSNTCNIRLSLNNGVTHVSNKYSNNLNEFSFPATLTYGNAVLTNTQSTFFATVDITGLTNLDCTTANNYCGKFYITSSNPTETLSTISNTPYSNNSSYDMFPVSFSPVSPLQLSLTASDPSAPMTNGIYIPGGSISNLTGRTDPTLSDFVSIMNRNGSYNRVINQSKL